MTEIERILNAREKKIKKSFLSINLSKLKFFLKRLFRTYFEFRKYKKTIHTFDGWGLITTGTNPPWMNTNNQENLIFKEINSDLLKLILENKFELTQFQFHDVNYNKILNELMWRHYTVFNSVSYARKFSKSDKINLVECGVCDGLTIFYGMNLCEKTKTDYKAYLYDAWQELKSPNEKLRFNYSYLDIEKTKKNLISMQKNIIFNKGYIPSVFSSSKNPDHVNWLHIDLNSTEATLSSLEFFYEKLVTNGIILFDDYGGFNETRRSIDSFFADKKGHFFNSPTGQAIFFKK